ncbi:MAG: hypothetical protein AAB229_05945 [Candidatus Hydrogenedentota bacterium]
MIAMLHPALELLLLMIFCAILIPFFISGVIMRVKMRRMRRKLDQRCDFSWFDSRRDEP